MNFSAGRTRVGVLAPFRAKRRSSRAFTLLEVVIASGILFMCLFTILALLSVALRNARALQKKKGELASMAAAEIYVLLTATNQVAEGSGSGDFGNSYPEYRYNWSLEEFATNGLCRVYIVVEGPRREMEAKMETEMYLPTLKKKWQ